MNIASGCVTDQTVAEMAFHLSWHLSNHLAPDGCTISTGSSPQSRVCRPKTRLLNVAEGGRAGSLGGTAAMCSHSRGAGMPAYDGLQLPGSATVITGSARLSRQILHEFDTRQRDQGEQLWESPDILDRNAWLSRCWSECVDSAPAD